MTEGCDACHEGKCIHCEYGYELGMFLQCQKCNTGAWNDDPALPWCKNYSGVRMDANVCGCDGYGKVEKLLGSLQDDWINDPSVTDGEACRVCSKGCMDCSISNGHPKCNRCQPEYRPLADMEHLCMFVPDEEQLPMGMYFEMGKLAASSDPLKLFKFNLSDDMSTLEVGYNGSIGQGNAQSTWNASLDSSYARRDSINHATRGMWFDGKYDYLVMNRGVLPPRFGAYFWTKVYHDGTLISTNAVHDEAN